MTEFPDVRASVTDAPDSIVEREIGGGTASLIFSPRFFVEADQNDLDDLVLCVLRLRGGGIAIGQALLSDVSGSREAAYASAYDDAVSRARMVTLLRQYNAARE